jgi:hypothetical protein
VRSVLWQVRPFRALSQVANRLCHEHVVFSQGWLTCQCPPGSQGLHSLPHGAGRVLSRLDAKNAFQSLSVAEMTHTDLDSYVVSKNEALLRTEHPECYKDISGIMDTLESEYGVRIIARFRPLLTLKW